MIPQLCSHTVKQSTDFLALQTFRYLFDLIAEHTLWLDNVTLVQADKSMGFTLLLIASVDTLHSCCSYKGALVPATTAGINQNCPRPCLLAYQQGLSQLLGRPLASRQHHCTSRSPHYPMSQT